MDGIKSTLRKSFLQQYIPSSKSIDPVWSGTMVYRGFVERDVLDKEFPGHRTITTPMTVSCYCFMDINSAEACIYPVRRETQGERLRQI